MHIVFIVDAIQCPHRAPAWCDELAKLGCQVEMVTPSYNSYQKKLIQLDKNISFEWIEDKKFKSPYKRYFTNSHILNKGLEKIKNKVSNNDLNSRYNLWNESLFQIISEINQKNQIDFLITSVSPFELIDVVRKIATLNNLKWIVDYRDLWTLNHRHNFTNENMVQKELELISSSTSLITVSNNLKEKLEFNFKKEAQLVPNGYEKVVHKRIKNKNYPRKLVLTGSWYPQHQNIHLVIEALSRVNQNSVIFELEITGPSIRAIKKSVKSQLGKLPTWLKLKPECSRLESFARQESADILLVLSWEDPNEPGIIGTKIYEYLSTGNPIVLTGGFESSELTNLIHESGAGVWAKDSNSLEAILNNFQDTGRIFSKRNSEFISKYSVENLMKEMQIWLESLIKANK